MASLLASKPASSTIRKASSLFPASFLFLRNLTTAQKPAPPSDATKKKRRKQKNLFEVAQFLPNWGIGYHMAKAHWTGVSYEITKINLYKDGRHGKAWGLAHRDGTPIEPAPRKISGVHKRCWKYLPNVKKIAPNMDTTGREECGPKQDAQSV